jgi:hypothetical protein
MAHLPLAQRLGQAVGEDRFPTVRGTTNQNSCKFVTHVDLTGDKRTVEQAGQRQATGLFLRLSVVPRPGRPRNQSAIEKNYQNF